MTKILLQTAFYFSLLAFAFHSTAATIKVSRTPNGRFYGRVLDERTGKGIEAASVQIWQDGYDEVTHEAKPLLKGGQLTEPNGDFSIDNLPSQGYMKLKVSALGYVTLEKRVSFDVVFDKKKGFDIDAGTFDKDLGNILLKPDNKELQEVVVKADEPFMKTAVDRKIYNVEKMTLASGGTATDAMKGVPGVNVDLDGKVSVRNASPTIFVDGKPTNLSLDQIPANSIQSIEVITNPSAKYDASNGGGAGIINIVLKKDKRMGYNGNVVLGINRRLQTTTILGLNFREKKLNIFLGANDFRNKSIAEGSSYRENKYSNPIDEVAQTSYSVDKNQFMNLYGGFDWLINNRNTLTISQTYTSGTINSMADLNINYDSSETFLPYIKGGISLVNRNSNNNRKFINWGSSLQYKKLFTKNGKELTADLFYSNANSDFGSSTANKFTDISGNNYRNNLNQRQNGDGGVSFLIGQVDYAEPFGKKHKWETGVRTQITDFSSNNKGEVEDSGVYKVVTSQTNAYSYKEQIHAGYVTYSYEHKDWSYQLGMRAESYVYDGLLKATNVSFRNYYPISLFPSLFLTYKIDDDQDIQLSSGRRVNRPNFFQLIPYTDFSDSLNLSKGNPALKPEYSYQTEVSYIYTWERKKSFLANAYFRTATNLITRIQRAEYSNDLQRNIILSTYDNAASTMAYGLELNYQTIFGKKIEMNTNVNIYHSEISGNSLSQTATTKQNTMFAKYYIIYKYSKVLLFQLMADYNSRVSLQPDGSGGSGPFFQSSSSSSAQGYQRQSGGIDLGIKYEFTLKKDKDKKKKDASATKPGSLVLNFSDILHTRRADTYSSSQYMVQNTFYTRDWRMVRLTFSYRFGKFDTSLLRRKNQNRNSGPQI